MPPARSGAWFSEGLVQGVELAKEGADLDRLGLRILGEVVGQMESVAVPRWPFFFWMSDVSAELVRYSQLLA